ncbi:hypothetical protein ABID21_005009 [Pseudorhizobium tarimense]|uniref:Uncharacterized protein n=1 Tax=Pseudorhizobium tarimense TaxID=1079109 RepID=A0ABV2HE95_9HYPH
MKVALISISLLVSVLAAGASYVLPSTNLKTYTASSTASVGR